MLLDFNIIIIINIIIIVLNASNFKRFYTDNDRKIRGESVFNLEKLKIQVRKK